MAAPPWPTSFSMMLLVAIQLGFEGSAAKMGLHVSQEDHAETLGISAGC